MDILQRAVLENMKDLKIKLNNKEISLEQFDQALDRIEMNTRVDLTWTYGELPLEQTLIKNDKGWTYE